MLAPGDRENGAAYGMKKEYGYASGHMNARLENDHSVDLKYPDFVLRGRVSG